MKRSILLLAVLFALVAPATASAHADYYNVTLNGDPWSQTYVFNASTGWTVLNCWEVTAIAPGYSAYVRNAGAETRFGLAVGISYSDFHPDWSDDIVTGQETRYFYSIKWRTGLATRRVWYTTGAGLPFQKAIKFVNDSSPNSGKPVVIRANC